MRKKRKNMMLTDCDRIGDVLPLNVAALSPYEPPPK
jgi:hypothetical protein